MTSQCEVHVEINAIRYDHIFTKCVLEPLVFTSVYIRLCVLYFTYFKSIKAHEYMSKQMFVQYSTNIIKEEKSCYYSYMDSSSE